MSTQKTTKDEAPAMNGKSKKRDGRLLRYLPIGKKMALMVAAMILPLMVLLVVFSWQMYKTINFTKMELEGLHYYHPLEEMGGAINIRSANVALSIGGSSADTRQIDAEIDQIATEMDELDQQYGNPATMAAWKAIREDWTALKAMKFSNTEDSVAAHAGISNKMADLRTTISTDWGMALDPVATSYYMLDVAVAKIPEIQNMLGQLRALIAASSTLPVPTDDQRLAMIRLSAIAQDRVAQTVSELAIVRGKAVDEVGEVDSVKAISLNWNVEIDNWLTDLSVAVNQQDVSREMLSPVSIRGAALPEALDKTHDLVMTAAEDVLNERKSNDTLTLVLAVTTVLIIVAIALRLAYAIIWRVVGSIKRLQFISARISEGQYDNTIDAEGRDELGLLFASVDAMQKQLGSDAANRAVSEALISRLRGGLAATSANVMIADTDNIIIYMNDAAKSLFSGLESELRKEIPGFDANALVGVNIDRFHKSPSHQRNLLGKLNSTHKAKFQAGSKHIHFTANPIVGDNGERLGTVVEWLDNTAIVTGEQEITSSIDAFLKGDLSRRLVEEGKEGFHALFAKQLNALIGNVSEIVHDVHGIVEATSAGNLDRRVATEGKSGLAKELGSGINDLVQIIGGVVSEVGALVNAANDGDLTKRIETAGKPGLLVKIGSGINDLTENMASVVSQVKQAASEVSRGADEISQGNTNLSQRTEEQASSLEETASSMEEMTSTVKQNADNAGQASQLAVAARDQAEKGGAVVAKAVRAMTDINDASKKIADIIGVIDEIAFQTNLLALNAAVEAARAGEQGRGFAVVASEVRNLAGRSATAAKEIKALIQDSVKKVDEGSTLVTQSGATLEQIVSAVKKVTDIVAEIAAASNEQSAGIDQVNKAVMQLDELTQQNAALVEEASAASQAMAEQARGLNDSMHKYKVRAMSGWNAGAATGGGDSSEEWRATA